MSAKKTRSFAAVLFRRISTKTRKAPETGVTKELFMSLPEPQKNAIREKLLRCLENESVPNVRNKIGDAVAELARQYSDDGIRLTSATVTKWSLTYENSR